jgi:hypothetical protein
MKELTIRIHFRRQNGKVEDNQEEFALSYFHGILPSPGDRILDPGVLQGLDRRDPENRNIWTVVGRVFNPRDLRDYVALIVEERKLTLEEEPFL